MPRVITRVGIVLLEQGKADDAIDAWRRLLQVDPSHLEAMQHLEALLRAALGYEVATFLRTPEEMHAAAMHDDFFLSAETSGVTDANGNVTLQLPMSVTTAGSGKRFVHVTAGPVYPLVEKYIVLE